MTLTNDQIKYNTKLISSLENTGTLSKGTTTKITVHEGGIPGSFLVPLLRVDLPLMRNVHTPLTKSVLIPLRLTPPASGYVVKQMKL